MTSFQLNILGAAILIATLNSFSVWFLWHFGVRLRRALLIVLICNIAGLTTSLGMALMAVK